MGDFLEELLGIGAGVGATVLSGGNIGVGLAAYQGTKGLITTRDEVADRNARNRINNPTVAENSVSSANDAYNNAKDILNPAYAQSREDITTLLSKARSTLEPLRQTTYQKQLEDVLTGEKEVTDLPGYEAKARTIRNILASQGLSQSVSATSAAYEPLVSSTFSDLEDRASNEITGNRQIAGSVAGLFSSEAKLLGESSISEAESIINTQLRKRGLDIGEQQFQTNLDEARRIRKSTQEADALSGLIELGTEFGPELFDFVGSFLDKPPGVDASQLTYNDYSSYT